jgi:hypothetical protein
MYDDGTNIGVGTTSPGYKLDVSGRIRGAGSDYHILSVTDSSAQLRLERTGTSTGLMYIGSDDVGFKVFDPSFNTRLTVTSAGNVGIGTTTPSYKLDVVGEGRFGTGAKAIIGTDGTYAGYGVLGFGGTSNGSNRIFGYDGGSDGLYIAAADTKGIQFWTDGSTTQMTITAFGNVGIGTTTPTSNLQVQSNNLSAPAFAVSKSFSGGGDGTAVMHAFGFDSGIANTGIQVGVKGTGSLDVTSFGFTVDCQTSPF